MTVSELGERALLARIQAKLSATTRPAASLVVGIGDDAAVVATTRNAHTVVTTDALVEGVHFERILSTPAQIGSRALSVNLSDLAAMGATPRWALLSLAMPDDLAVTFVETLAAGVGETAFRYRTEIIGGNLTRTTGPLVVDVTAIGEVKPRHALTRSGGRPGDGLYVSGTIGAAAAGLEMLKARGVPSSSDVEATRASGDANADRDEYADCITRYQQPEARVALGVAVGHARAARAAMDLSDGLGDAAHQLAEASGCGVEIDASALPIAPGARKWWNGTGADAVLKAITGGDDYELVFAVPDEWAGRLRHARSRVAGSSLTRIGTLIRDRTSRVLLRDEARVPLPGGFEHFRDKN